ncbi:hypothetical protein SLS53_008843 [Cytospora paraplurivora]|uniref:Uncharacterized protein n=1 Tax=Cytospora paraplurivora TaxID=2898453 RepID=A0AAN9YCC3_9PEZI
MFARSLTLASALVASTMAQSTSVTSLFLYGAEGDSIVASVIAAAPAATSYFVTCPEGTDSNDCGMGPGMTYILGPSTYGIHATYYEDNTLDLGCKVAHETMTCVQTYTDDDNELITTTGLVSDLTDDVLRVTITAGLDLLSGGGSATATASDSATSATAQPSASTSAGPSATGSTASSSGESSAAATGTSASTSTKTSASSSSTASGAAPRVNGNIVVVAGALVGLSGLMLLL